MSSINHTWFFKQQPDEIWAYLTKPELVEQWLMKTDIAPQKGHRFQFHTKPMPQFNFNGIINCEVLEAEPNKRLSYTWKGGGDDGVITLDSVVRWTLEPKDGGTELVLEHSGFKDEDVMALNIMSEGWDRNVKRIMELLTEKA